VIMAIFTPAELDEQIAAYKAALLTLTRSQSYELPDGSRITRADLPEIRKILKWLETERANTETGASTVIMAGRPKR
jgi:hypothetical protein